MLDRLDCCSERLGRSGAVSLRFFVAKNAFEFRSLLDGRLASLAHIPFSFSSSSSADGSFRCVVDQLLWPGQSRHAFLVVKCRVVGCSSLVVGCLH